MIFNMETLNMKDLIYKDRDGNIITNPEEYFNALENNVSITEKLEVGDVVKLKRNDDRIEILYLDYVIPRLGASVDYAGKNLDNENPNLIVFNQKDIESYEKGKNHGKGKW